MHRLEGDGEKRRLLFIAYTLYRSDPRAIRLCQVAADDGYEVEALCLRDSEARSEASGIRVVRAWTRKYQGCSKLRYLLSYLSFFLEATLLCSRRAIRRSGRPSVVLVKNMPNTLVFCTLALRIVGVPVILDIRDSMPEVFEVKFGKGSVAQWLLLREERLSAAFAQRVLCVHEPHRDVCVQHGIPRAKIVPILNLPDPRVWRRCAVPENGRFTILYHGLLSERTGTDILLRACALVRKKDPCIRVQIIGGGDFFPSLVRLARELGIEDVVEMTGRPRPATEMPEVVSRADLLVVPQRDDAVGRIGLSRKLFEAVLLGVPVVIARNPPVEYYFEEDMVCFVRPGDVEGFAGAIERMMRDRRAREEMAQRARKFFEVFSWESEAGKLARVLDEVTRGVAV